LRYIKFLLLFIILQIATIPALLIWAIYSAEPDTKGINPKSFDSPDKALIAVNELVTKQPGAVNRPNIVVILADDLGYGDLGVQGSQALSTPSIDSLSAEGMRFTQFYSSAPICSPSRAGLLTGRYPLRSGITNALQAGNDTFIRSALFQLGIAVSYLNIVDMIGGENAVKGLPPSEITIPEALKVAGYKTMAIGKWHLGDFTVIPRYHPFNHGFDEFVGFNASNDDFPVAFWRGNEEVTPDIGSKQSQYTRLFTDEAVNFINRSGDEPFFLYLAHKDPHLPFYPSQQFKGQSDGGPFGDAVMEFDWSTGQVIEALKNKGIAENTLVIVSSDNGPWFDGSSSHLRGRKGQSYEGGFRVPFIAWWPGRIPAGTITAEPAMHTDLFPTFMQLAGLNSPTDRIIDGVSIVPLVDQQPFDHKERSLYFFHDYDLEAVRKGNWKYFSTVSHWVWPSPLDKPEGLQGLFAGGRDYTPAGETESIPVSGTWPLLYNLELDPDESYNVLKSNPDIANRLKKELGEWRDEFYSNPRGWQ
jgi:arylsulfatase A-like enzyme